MAEFKEYYNLIVGGPYLNFLLYGIIACVVVLVVINLGQRAGMRCIAFCTITAGLTLAAIGNSVSIAMRILRPEFADVVSAIAKPIFGQVAMSGYISLGIGVCASILGIIFKKAKERRATEGVEK